MAKIVSINIAAQKGVAKQPVAKAQINRNGLEADAHAGHWHRQVSLLAQEDIDSFAKKNRRKILPGEFAENLTVSGIDLAQVRLWDKFKINQAFLEVTQIGKSCHGKKCNIFKATGVCIMPKTGIFARVLRPGRIKRGDTIEHIHQALQAAIIVTSDRASCGDYADKSGPLLKTILEQYSHANRFRLVCDIFVIPDDVRIIHKLLKNKLAKNVDMIFTCGGTGIGPRDVTVDVVKKLLDKELPGIMETVRVKYGASNPNALLSRSMAGVAGKTLIFSLPGSPKAVEEYMGEIDKVLLHCLMMLRTVALH